MSTKIEMPIKIKRKYNKTNKPKKPKNPKKKKRAVYHIDTEKYFKYDASTGKSCCTIESCKRLMAGKRASNIIRHYRQIHNMHIVDKPPQDGDPTSMAWLWNSSNNAEEPDDHDVVDEKSSGSVSPALVNEDTDSPPPTPTPPATIRKSASKKTALKRTPDVLRDISAHEKEAQHKEEPPRKSPRCNSISQHTVMKAFGHNVCIQLQDMDRRQRIIAEKLISDVLFHGKLGNLHETTSIALQKVDRIVLE